MGSTWPGDVRSGDVDNMKINRTQVLLMSAWLAACTAAAAFPQTGEQESAAPAGPVDPRVGTHGDSAVGPIPAAGDGASSTNLTRPDALLDTDLDAYLNRLGRIMESSGGPWSIQDPLSPFGADFPLFGFVQAPSAVGSLNPGVLRPGYAPADVSALAGLAGDAMWPSHVVVPDVRELIQPNGGWGRLGGLGFDRVGTGGFAGSLPAWTTEPRGGSWPWAPRPGPFAAARPSQIIPPTAQWLSPAAGGDAFHDGLELPGLTGLNPPLSFDSGGIAPIPPLATGRLDLRLTGGDGGGLDSRPPVDPGGWDGQTDRGVVPAGSLSGIRAAPSGGVAVASRNLTSADLILADAAMTRGDFEMAERLYRRVLLLDGSNAAARFHRAVALFAKGSYDEAAVEVYSAFQANGAEAPTIRLRDVIFDHTLLEQRRQAMNTVIGQYATCERLLLHAYVEASCGRPRAALEDLQRAGAMDPKIAGQPAVAAWREALERRIGSE
ncbi:MAG: tetratricopeptide repeat protein [Phycisphaerales bacterium]|nr:MAG: tetratricopeptide repeat protein [Phycisphaerales bacterium]